jgi:uncharacterized membrane protein (UPF0127 family)
MMRYFFVLLLVCVCSSGLVAQSKPGLVGKKTAIIRGHSFVVEMAKTDEDWRRGLMFREKLAAHEGMFFWGEQERVQSFWMKNTLVPLDMIFISAQMKIVKIEKEAKPETETSHSSEVPAMHVLEILGGLSDRYGFKTGDLVQLK